MGTVLLLTSDGGLIRGYAKALGDAGHDCVVLASPNEAIERIRSHQAQIVVTSLTDSLIDNFKLFGEIASACEKTPVSFVIIINASVADVALAGQAVFANDLGEVKFRILSSEGRDDDFVRVIHEMAAAHGHSNYQ